ncbi:peptidoglycan recognition protein family protein [Streptomyces somaliensis]|uniref:Peptidoglycan recognition protein n=1 Tax=Streptomyces somaliensis (strain ATCC 33201 / DSM 40738 / JCM 12659 / KCTC 9044 / NCTC 11332 / NRRL B-12077 / IP 733) TaxID=1134445 RepID=A0AA44DAZ6_STRE0|nr:peptidoglycan recognition protein [Streptomyces somaliensis]NKY13309.1 peptidoglycan recognition protein [Streptomyces somaliensis DSM 40738]
MRLPQTRGARAATSLTVLGVLVTANLVLGPSSGPRGHGASDPGGASSQRAARHQGPRPVIVPRTAWRAQAVSTAPAARYAPAVRAAVIHHTSTPNGYDCASVPATLRDLYAGHAYGRDWDDIGYNFLVDACGTIYEGRAGGVDRAVVGAHTKGFNEGTVGIAAIGTFSPGTRVPEPMIDAIARLVAWKLDPSGPDPRGTVALVSTSDESRFPEGTAAVLPVVGGHADGYATRCPGAALYARLPEVSARAARLQRR